MRIKFEDLRSVLKSVTEKVYRDSAPSTANYPYIIYEYVGETQKRASNDVILDMPLYMVSYITKGVEGEIKGLKKALNNAGIIYESFQTAPYDENDDTVTQYITYVRCIHSVE